MCAKNMMPDSSLVFHHRKGKKSFAVNDKYLYTSLMIEWSDICLFYFFFLTENNIFCLEVTQMYPVADVWV